MKYIFTISCITLFFFSPVSVYDNTAQVLPFSQNWANTSLVATDDDWASVPGIIAYRGDGLTAVTAADPQTLLGDGSATPVDVIANQTNPNTLATGGVAEFEIADPVVALQGSGTADAPHLVINFTTTGMSGITVAYNLRDVDGSTDDAVQPVALQYRVGSSGNFTNVPGGFVADATTGAAATLVTPVSVVLPAAADDQALVQIRIITTNAVGNDEWVGIDNLNITAGTTPITFIDFSARQAPGRVYLNWRAHSTDNISYFLLERKDNGSFNTIGRINANSGDKHYAFTDNNAASSMYRLKMIDADGKFRYSPVLNVQRNSKVISLNGLFPTPAADQLTMQVSSNKKQAAIVEVLDITGRPVRKTTLNLIEGVNNYPVNIIGIAPGNYLLRVSINAEVLTAKFSKQ